MANDHRKSQEGQDIPTCSEDDARAYFEAQRWPNGPVCPHCKSSEVTRMGGDAHRDGTFQCNACREQFTVTVGTVMEDSHIPLAKWALAFHLMASSKKGISALQLMRNLGLGSYRTAWFLAHRIREAMRGPTATADRLGGIVEVDETYVGGKSRGKGMKAAMRNKTAVVSLVERGGRKRSVVMERVTADNIKKVIREHVKPDAEIHTDESPVYTVPCAPWSHHSVNHSKKEYARKREDGTTVTTNTAEGGFALLKRGVTGTFHHLSKKHLHRYVCEFDFRWDGRRLMDVERRDAAVKGAEGRRLTYKEPIGKVG